MSIRNKLLSGLSAGLLVLSLASGGLLYYWVRTALARQFDAALTAKARAIASLVKRQGDGGLELDFSADSLPEFGPTGQADYFQIWREDGVSVGRSPSLAGRDLPRGADGTAVPLHNMVLPSGRPGRSIELQVVPAVDEDEKDDSDEDEKDDSRASPAKAAPAENSGVRVVVALDREDLDRTLTMLLSALLGVAVLMGIGTVAVVTVAVRAGLRPLEQLARRAAGIDAESLGLRFPIDGLPAELQPICRRLNESLERLDQAFKRERRFTADVAHELRTPIAELRALADVALQWQHDPEVAAWLKDVREIAQQMEKTVSVLLALARCQSGATGPSRRPVALADVVQEAWNGQRERAAGRGLAVAFEVPPSFVLTTDRTLLLSIVANLLSNAVEYATQGGPVACRAESRGAEVQFSVSNETDSLAPDDLPHLFEPFWRKDPARSDPSHSGLGLALVAAYAEALGGRVEARLPSAGTLCLTLAVPCDPQA